VWEGVACLYESHILPHGILCLEVLHGFFKHWCPLLWLQTQVALFHILIRFNCVHVFHLLQEHLLLAWPLFVFFLTLAFYLYPEDYAHIHMQCLFWLTILSPYLFWLYSLWSFSCSLVLYLLARSLDRFPYAPSILLVPILSYPEPLSLLLVHDIVTPYPYHTLDQWLGPHYPYHSFSVGITIWLGTSYNNAKPV